jgi:hypothetical protein
LHCLFSSHVLFPHPDPSSLSLNPWQPLFSIIVYFRNVLEARHQWLIPVILATWEAEIRKIAVPGQPEQIVHETSSWTIAGHSDVCLSSQW